MFPNGVIYEGVSEEPLSFRGESGANDSMCACLLKRAVWWYSKLIHLVRIPLGDNLLEVEPFCHIFFSPR